MANMKIEEYKEYKKQLKHEEKHFEKQRRNKLKEEMKNKRKGENLEANKLKLDKRKQQAETKKINEINKLLMKMNIKK